MVLEVQNPNENPYCRIKPNKLERQIVESSKIREEREGRERDREKLSVRQ